MLSSDQQIPYHDPRAIELWFKVMKWFKPDVVDILGDTDDQDCYSRFTEGRPAEFLQAQKDAEGAKEFYVQTRKTAKKDADIFSALGNHDIRVFDYFEKKLPDYINDITPNALWGL